MPWPRKVLTPCVAPTGTAMPVGNGLSSVTAGRRLPVLLDARTLVCWLKPGAFTPCVPTDATKTPKPPRRTVLWPARAGGVDLEVAAGGITEDEGRDVAAGRGRGRVVERSTDVVFPEREAAGRVTETRRAFARLADIGAEFEGVAAAHLRDGGEELE